MLASRATGSVLVPLPTRAALALAALLCALLGLALIAGPARASGTVVFSDDFESAFAG